MLPYISHWKFPGAYVPSKQMKTEIIKKLCSTGLMLGLQTCRRQGKVLTSTYMSTVRTRKRTEIKYPTNDLKLVTRSASSRISKSVNEKCK